MVDLMGELGKIVFEDPLDATKSGSNVVGLFSWLESLAAFWNLAGDAMLAGSLAVALLFAAIALCAGKVDSVALSGPTRVGLWIFRRRCVVACFWSVGCSGGRSFANSRACFLEVGPVLLHCRRKRAVTGEEREQAALLTVRRSDHVAQ